MRYLWCLCLLSTVALAADKPDDNPAPDPMTWKPPVARPVFIERVQGAEFTKRFDAALAKINVAELEKSTVPAEGIQVLAVRAESQGEKFGIKPGDVVVEANDTQMASLLQIMSRNNTKPTRLVWFTPTGDKKLAQIQPGRVGIELEEYFRPDLLYVRGKKRSPKWEKFVLVAAATFRSDPDLAESCLLQAVANGFDDPIIDKMGTMLATVQLRPERALSFGWRWLLSEPASFIAGDYFVKNSLYGFQPQAGLAYSQTPSPFITRFPDCAADFKGIIQNAAAIPQHILKGPPPSLAAKAMLHDDLAFRMEIPPGNDSARAYLDRMAATDSIKYKAAKEPLVLTFGPAVKDIDVSFIMSVQESKDAPPDTPRLAGFSLVNAAAPPKAGAETGVEGVLGIMLKQPHTLVIVASSTAYNVNLLTLDPTFNFSAPHQYRLVAHKGRVEVLVDGKRVYYEPISLPGKNLLCHFKADGVDCAWTGISAVELVDTDDKISATIRNINKPEFGGQTRLMRSILRRHAEDVPLLVDRGADISIKDSLQRTAIDLAAWTNQKATVDYLVSKGATAELFHFAATGQTEKVQTMLKENPALVSKALPCGYTAFLGAVVNDHLDTVKALMQYPISVNDKDQDGVTALMWAAKNQSKAMIELVLKKLPKLNVTDKFGRNALYIVRDNAELTALLKGNGATEVAAPPTGD